MNKIEVRLAQASDIKALAKVQTSSWKVAFKSILSADVLEQYTDVKSCTQMLQGVLDESKGNLYIAYLNGEPCGEIFWCDDNEETAEIVAVHSLESSWGTGVGQAMFNKVLLDIKASDKSKVYLWVFEKNMRARRFYEKYGFIHNGETKISAFDNAVEFKYIRDL